MADIFISYAREDEATARQLRDALASQGWDVSRDKEGIVTGTSWGDSIEHALRDAKCVDGALQARRGLGRSQRGVELKPRAGAIAHPARAALTLARQ